MRRQLWERLKVRGEEKMRGTETGGGDGLRNRMCVHAGQSHVENLKTHVE